MSAIVARIRHQFSDARPAKRAGLILLALAAFSVVGTSAWAYWTTIGHGTASATTGTLNPPDAPVWSYTTGTGDVGLTWTSSSGTLSPTGYYVNRIDSSDNSEPACATDGTHLLTGPWDPSGPTCTDQVVSNGTYRYTVTAVYNSWTATSNESTPVEVVNDAIPPSVTINQAAGQADPTNSGTVVFTAVFSEPVTGFTDTAVTIGGTASGTKTVAISGTGPTYTVTVSGATGNGTITASIGANTVKDLAGNANTASTSGDNTVTLDTLVPTVTINQAAAQADPTNSGTVVFTAVFSEPVTGFTDTAVTIGGTASGTKTVVIGGTGPTYTVTVSGATGNGTITASIGANTVQDLAGNANTASTSGDNTVTLDTTSPTVTLASTPSLPNGSNGWFKSSVTWTPSGSDLSGIASCQAPVAYSTTDSVTASVTRTCTDFAGNIGTGTATFQYDGTAPSGSVTSPATLASVLGTSVSVTSTNAADTTSGVASVQFQVKPAAGSFTNIGAADTTSPYAASWDTTSVVNGSYLLQTVVTDEAGNTFTSGSTSVTVANVYAFVVSNPGAQTAGTPFGGGTLQLRVNGVNSITFTGVAYTGTKAIAFTGPSKSPSGTAPTYPSTVAFTDGLGTIGANAITLTTAQSTTLTATMTADGIAGTSPSFTVAVGGATRLAWSNVTPGTGASAPGAAAPTPCLFTCAWSNFGTGSKTFTATVSVTDSLGNTVSGVGAGKSVSVTGTGVTDGILSLASVGPAVTSTQFTYTSPSSNANFTNVLTATGAPAGWPTATATITKN